MIRKDEARGGRPFFENIALHPARPVLGRVETPEGAPAEGVEIVAVSRDGKPRPGPFEPSSIARVKTDRDGRFRIPVTTPGIGMLWIVPRGFAPESHEIPEDRRGDLGTFAVKKGIATSGRALDARGQPVAGLFLQVGRDREDSADRELLHALAFGDLIDAAPRPTPRAASRSTRCLPART